MSRELHQDPGELQHYLHALADGARPSQFFDLRYSPPGALMRRRYVSVLCVPQLARRISRLSPTADVFLGVALRDRARGDRTAISGSRVLYIEVDDPAADELLTGFACTPSMIVASGSPGHRHVYWRLRERASAAAVERVNRRLALALRGEPGCTDITRMLRPPGSLNHKHTPPLPVRLISHDAGARYALTELAATLPDDPGPRESPPARSPHPNVGRTALDRELLAIPAAEYVRVLTGREPNRQGKVLCPFHQETNPSLQLYPDGTFYCFGARCKKGGTIYDFAAHLWGIGTRESDFLKLRRRLATTFGTTQPPNGGS